MSIFDNRNLNIDFVWMHTIFEGSVKDAAINNSLR